MEHFYYMIGENWFTYKDLYQEMVSKSREESHFVEIGSWKGRSSCFMGVEILNSGKKIKFDCIDTWLGSKNTKRLISNLEDILYQEFIQNIHPINGIINPIRMTSSKASELYADLSLDFAFIDASHEYEDVMNDLTSWFPKIKNGGIIAGHDYPNVLEVVQAVHDFFKKKNLNYYAIPKQFCWVHKK